MCDSAESKWGFLPISFPCVYERGADRLKPSKGELAHPEDVLDFDLDDLDFSLDDEAISKNTPR